MRTFGIKFKSWLSEATFVSKRNNLEFHPIDAK
jgi:hypothetical protein